MHMCGKECESLFACVYCGFHLIVDLHSVAERTRDRAPSVRASNIVVTQFYVLVHMQNVALNHASKHMYKTSREVHNNIIIIVARCVR